MINNPFKINTNSYIDWETLKDLNWHCSKCELKSGQAKTWQIWRHTGLQLAKDEKDNFYKYIKCPSCDSNTVHRKLLSLEILEETKTRSGISTKFAKKVKDIYKDTEALFLREFPPRELEVDHKFPQIRWSKNENKNLESMTSGEIKSKFILLTRSNNLLKSRQCEKCLKTGTRGNFPGIYFWYVGDENWTGIDKFDENGCHGCFWYDPFKWREELNKIIK